MTSIPRFSVNNPVLVNLFMVSLLVGGVYSGLTLTREIFPESRPQRILITTLYPGATPAEVEKGITLKIEEQIKHLDGVDKVKSSITEGRSVITVEMVSGFEEIDVAVNDIKSAIDSIPPEDFPEDALETQVAKFDPRFPVIAVSLYGDLDDRALKILGERLKTDILTLPGISDAALTGTRREEISVEVLPGKLIEYGLSFMDVADTIAASNLDLPGGQVRTASANIAVRTLGEKDQGYELRDIVLRSDVAGGTVFLRDVATVVDGFEDVEVSSRFNALPAISVVVSKTADQDAIEIAGMVKALVAGKMGWPFERPWMDGALARLSGRDVIRDAYETAQGDPYPPDIQVKARMDLSRLIEDRLDLLKRNGRWGLMLVFLSLLFFLHWRVALWVMMGLVLAITGTLVCMKMVGLTLNLMTMGGFIIVLGLLVDDAIIVSEHVYSKIERGMEPKLAAIKGTEEVMWPVICAIATTIVAFAPLRFIEGQIGDWMGVLPLVVCLALCMSLVEALTVLPSHLAHSLHGNSKPSDKAESGGRVRALRRKLRRAQELLHNRVMARYEGLLRLASRYRYVTISALCSLLIMALGAVMGGHVPFVFLQKMDAETLMANIRMGVGTPAEATGRAAEVIEHAAQELDDLSTLLTLIGLHVSEEGKVLPPQSHLGQIWIELTPSTQRLRSSDDITQELRSKTADIPGVEKLSFGSIHGGPAGDAIHVDIRGERLEDIVAVSAYVKDYLGQFDGVRDIVDDFDAGSPEVQIELFESARSLGLTTASLGTQIRAAFYGLEARKVQRGREDVKIMVRYPEEFRKSIYDVESMRIATPSGAVVPFSEVARLTEGIGYASINRTDQRRTVAVTADVDETITNAHQVMNALSGEFPKIMREYPGVELAYGGQRLEMRKSFSSLNRDFLIAMLLIFVILAGLFRSYVQPLIVMSVIPFGLIGAVMGHFIMGYPLTIASVIGLVALTGVVVNDALVLVVFINRRVKEGVDPTEAVVEGGKDRLRPILLTSITTVLGMAPLLLETSFQAKFLIPMGLSLSGGLIFATVLTLVAVPSMYLIVGDVRRVVSNAWLWLLGKEPEAQSLV